MSERPRRRLERAQHALVGAIHQQIEQDAERACSGCIAERVLQVTPVVCVGEFVAVKVGLHVGSLSDEHVGVIVVLTGDVPGALRGHVAPARIEQVERRMLGYDVT